MYVGFEVLHNWKLKFASICKSVNLPPECTLSPAKNLCRTSLYRSANKTTTFQEKLGFSRKWTRGFQHLRTRFDAGRPQCRGRVSNHATTMQHTSLTLAWRSTYMDCQSDVTPYTKEEADWWRRGFKLSWFLSQPASWSSGSAFVSGAGGLRFKS